jgi:hypothetical protein
MDTRETSECIFPTKGELMKAKGGNSTRVNRCVGGGLLVSIRREDYATHRYASSANLNRILSRIGAVDDFLLMTPFNTIIPLGENQKRFEKIPNMVRSLLETKRVNAYWLVGHWTDEGDLRGHETPPAGPHAGASIDHLEYSWLLVKRDEQIKPSDWLLTATLLADCYAQYAFVIRLSGETTLRSSDGTIWETLRSERGVKDTWATLARLRSRPDPFGYGAVLNARATRSSGTGGLPPDKGDGERIAGVSSYGVRGDGSHHEADFFLAVTGNISSKMHFEAIGANETLPNQTDSRSPWNFPTPAQLYAAKWIRGRP